MGTGGEYQAEVFLAPPDGLTERPAFPNPGESPDMSRPRLLDLRGILSRKKVRNVGNVDVTDKSPE